MPRSYRENDEEGLSQAPTFLTKLQEIMAILEEEVLPKVEENTHLKLVNELQILYNLHTGSNTSCLRRNFTATATPSNTANNNVTIFIRVLSELDTEYNSWTYDTNYAYGISVNPNTTQSVRDEINTDFREFSNYNRLMREALGYWNALSLDEQTNIRLGPHINDPSRRMMDAVVWDGPIDRIIVERAPNYPTEIYDVFYDT